MPRCAFCPNGEVAFYCWVTLKSCYRNWTHRVSHINTWTVFSHSSSTESESKLLSIAVKCLIKCRAQSVLLKGTGEWTDCPPSRKKAFVEKVQKAYIELLQTTKSPQTNQSFFAERIEQVQRQNMSWN